jgi:hypothetical protein
MCEGLETQITICDGQSSKPNEEDGASCQIETIIFGVLEGISSGLVLDYACKP